jgi:hypothetical protein
MNDKTVQAEEFEPLFDSRSHTDSIAWVRYWALFVRSSTAYLNKTQDHHIFKGECDIKDNLYSINTNRILSGSGPEAMKSNIKLQRVVVGFPMEVPHWSLTDPSLEFFELSKILAILPPSMRPSEKLSKLQRDAEQVEPNKSTSVSWI